MAPSTFASAAAGNSSTPSRPDSTSSEWSRRANGATQTFRRPSLATNLSSTTQQRDTATASSVASPGVYVPPHANTNRGTSSEQRYGRNQLLELFKSLHEGEALSDGMSGLYVDGWKPNITNGTNHGWGRKEEAGKDAHPGADVCWDRDGSIHPLCAADMTDEERETFSTSVNSPLKPPAQNQNKDGTQKEGLSLRKVSISQVQAGAGAFGLSSPTSTRSATRRREPSDAYPFPSTNTTTPANSRFFREESTAATPPAALLRRTTGLKDSDSPGNAEESEKAKGKQRDGGAESGAPFGSFKRVNTGPFSAGVTGPSSPWSATPGGAGFSPMGSFGNFAIGGSGQPPGPTEKRSVLSGLRGESKFKGILSKDSSDDIGRMIEEKSSIGELNKTSEADPGRSTPSWVEGRGSRPVSGGTDPYDEDDIQSGSAALRGSNDDHAQGAYGTPIRQSTKDDAGFGAFGMTSDQSFRDMVSNRDSYGQHFTPQHRVTQAPGEPMSPTSTNPYQSPEHEKGDREEAEAEGAGYLPGLGGFSNEQGPPSGLPGLGAFGNLGRAPNQYEVPPSDRSQTSSTGPGRGFPSLGGLGGLAGLGGSPWSTQANVGTPSREKSGLSGQFGAFGSDNIQSPSLAGLGGSGTNLFGLGSGGTIGRSGKIGSLFPQAMQEQMRDQGRLPHDEVPADESERPQSGFGAFGRDVYGSVGSGSTGPNRDANDSPFRQNRAMFEETPGANIRDAASPFHAPEPGSASYSLGQVSSNLQTPALPASGQGPISQTRGAPTSTRPTASISSVASNQPPAAQQRTMVMPDRMRWIYRDPQGNTQGPWTGLEMHDWYKAGFFSPELLVKKIEDPDFEPLAHLIRRIGNSREPFLVPQIGIPHGDPPTPASNTWGINAPASGAQPPFPNSFPTFGTTLTAEQQNALERRKQEEQYLMARQKEHLVQQQLMVKQMQMQGQGGMLPHQLQHHSSARSLHSQPSYGSITSPGGFQSTQGQGSMPPGSGPGFFDNQFRAAPSATLGPVGANTSAMQQELPGMMQQLNVGRSAQPGFAGADPFGHDSRQEASHAAASAAIQTERARLAREQAQHDAAQDDGADAQAALERMQQFLDLKERMENEHHHSSLGPFSEITGHFPAGMTSGVGADSDITQEDSSASASQVNSPDVETVAPALPAEHLTLTEQVQKAQAHAQAQAYKQAAAPQSPWAKVDTSIPQPFPAAQQPGSPLMAPVAQRKQNLADTLHQEARSGSETPSVETPSASIAPWAKDTIEAPRGPSLREIQEAEAKKAAAKEEMAAAVRRAALERDIAAAQAAALPPAPGLPSSANWASTASSSTPTSTTAPSAWAKTVGSGKTATSGAAGKKTLSQIQKEEEARKQRAASAVSTASPVTVGSPALSSGKRYADLASKTMASPPSTGGAWTTVGAGGKAKGPAVPIPTGPARSISGTAVPAAKAKVAATPSRSATMGAAASQQSAQEQFKKWAVGELKGDLKKGINVDDLVANLVSLGSDVEIITEAVHSTSQTMDSRHFAEEFIRRRKLADKGIMDALTTPSPSSSEAKSGGGWSEVAKKNPQPKEELNNFKVVAAKKKGGKR